jgi:hypothetical protein
MKADVMNEPTTDEPNKPITDHKQRGIGLIELLFTIASIGAAVVVAALGTSKRPPGAGD